MNDKVFIDDIEIFAKHGIFSDEKNTFQRFLVSVNARFDASHAKTFDEIYYTVDYSKLLLTIINATEKSSFNLIEKLASHIASEIFTEFKLIISLDITIKKFPDNLSHKTFKSIGFSSSFFRNDQ